MKIVDANVCSVILRQFNVKGMPLRNRNYCRCGSMSIPLYISASKQSTTSPEMSAAILGSHEVRDVNAIATDADSGQRACNAWPR